MKSTQSKYTRAAKFYDTIELPIEKLLFVKNRQRAVHQASGEVLEVGVGTGKNLPYYPPSAQVTAIDFSSGMLKYAQKRLNEVALTDCRLIKMDAQNMSFSDQSFDSVLASFVLCTIPEPMQGLGEVHRVLKKGGKAIFLEHMKSRNGLINVFLYMMNALSLPILGTSMTRSTKDNIEKAGFRIVTEENLLFDVVRLIVAEKT